jgi:hypothetical protein
MFTKREFLSTTAALAAISVAPMASDPVQAQAQPPKMKMTTPIPAEITTPSVVQTRIGSLKFFDGIPDRETVQRVYDNLDLFRGVQVFLETMPGASLVAMRKGYRHIGAADGNVAVFETLMDSKSL